MSDSVVGAVVSEVLAPRDVFEGWLFGLPNSEWLVIAGAVNSIREVLRRHPGAVIPREVLEGWFGRS